MPRIVCCQLGPRVADPARNAAAVEPAVRAAADAGADVIVLPELVTCGYPFESPAQARAAALDADDPLFRSWAELAGDAVLVLGFAERDRTTDRLYDSALLLDGDRPAVVYRKTHLWNTEKDVFTPGSAPPPVVDTRAGRIALVVCYDAEIPELTRSVARRGAELLVVPANWPRVAHPDGWPTPEVVLAMATARVNRLAVAICDRADSVDSVGWTGQSAVIGPDGWPVARAGTGPRAATVTADVDLAAGRDKAISPRNDVFGDLRPELYR